MIWILIAFTGETIVTTLNGNNSVNGTSNNSTGSMENNKKTEMVVDNNDIENSININASLLNNDTASTVVEVKYKSKNCKKKFKGKMQPSNVAKICSKTSKTDSNAINETSSISVSWKWWWELISDNASYSALGKATNVPNSCSNWLKKQKGLYVSWYEEFANFNFNSSLKLTSNLANSTFSNLKS